jgi:hypothetical protein
MKKMLPVSTGTLVLAATVAVLLSSSPVRASLITINNPSFETPALSCTAGPGCFSEDVFNSWIPSGAVATFRPSVGPGQEFTAIPDGLQVAAIANGSAGEIYQDLSATLSANTTYTLTFWAGQRSDFPFDPGYTVSLMANGSTTLASDTGASPIAGSFVQRTLSFATGASPAQLGQTLRIDIFAPAGSGQADFDLFALNTNSNALPEPSSFGLLIIGLGLMAGARRLRTNS